MSQVSLRDLEIVGLKSQDKNLENLPLKREKERKVWENKCRDLSDKNDKLMKKVTEQLRVQGGKHILWDIIKAKETKLIPYLYYILDK